MRKISLLSSVLAFALLTGCSQKSPEVDMSVADTPAPEIIQQDGTSVDANTVSGTMSVEERISGLEKETKKIYFDFDKFNIRADMEPNIDADAKLFNEERAKNFSIKVEGNCDEWGSDEYNYALGLKRAKTVKDSLSAKGVESTRMVVISYGESKPVCEERTEACWAKNRRVEFKLLP